jgi:cell division transport system permease protein
MGDSLVMFLFSAGLGWLGAWLSVVSHLLKIEPR